MTKCSNALKIHTVYWRKIVNQCLIIIVRCLTNIFNLCLTNVVTLSLITIVNLCLTSIVKLCLTIIVKFIKHNFTHTPFGIWVLLMWVVPIQDNISLNYNLLFQGMTLWFQPCCLSTWVYLLLLLFYFFMFIGIYVFIYLWLHLINFFFRLPTYPWWGSSHFVVLNLRFLI